VSPRLTTYYRLAKPGIVYGNTIALIAGFLYFVVTSGSFDILHFVYAVLGTALVMCSACVANNIIDKDIDVYMKRTAKRALVTGEVSTAAAVIYSAVLVILGALLLYLTNTTSLILALSGWILYVIPYTYLKRVTYHATLVGTLPGAVPPLVGYYAAGGRVFGAAVSIFAIMVAWQMVHFYAIAIFRQAEYSAAKVPIITVVKGVPTTIKHMQVWTLLSAVSLITTIFFTHYWVYALLTLVLVGWWLRATVYVAGDDIAWSRRVFFASLWFLLAWLAIGAISALTLLV
jgi:protoheme IX farnesyltransferase